MNISEFIEQGRAVLGMEFGSTRIKAVLTDDNGKVLATGHGLTVKKTLQAD